MPLPLFIACITFSLLYLKLSPDAANPKSQDSNGIMVADYGRNACRTRQGFTEMPTSFSDPLNILRSSDMVVRN